MIPIAKYIFLSQFDERVDEFNGAKIRGDVEERARNRKGSVTLSVTKIAVYKGLIAPRRDRGINSFTEGTTMRFTEGDTR